MNNPADQKRATLTVALITKNEASNLPACLESVTGIADQIVVLDSGSSDATPDIARRCGCDFHVNKDWPGFGRQRQIAQQYAKCDWVFWIDADERVTPELAASIKDVLARPVDNSIYQVARLSHAFGQFIRHCGWYPGYVERLHPRSLTQYNDKLVHESLIVPDGAKLKILKGDLLHYTYKDLQDYLTKSANYAHAWALERVNKGKRSSVTKATLHSVSRFLRTYFFKLGFLDGRAGFLLAVLAAQSVFNKHADLALLTAQPSESPDGTQHENS